MQITKFVLFNERLNLTDSNTATVIRLLQTPHQTYIPKLIRLYLNAQTTFMFYAFILIRINTKYFAAVRVYLQLGLIHQVGQSVEACLHPPDLTPEPHNIILPGEWL